MALHDAHGYQDRAQRTICVSELLIWPCPPILPPPAPLCPRDTLTCRRVFQRPIACPVGSLYELPPLLGTRLHTSSASLHSCLAPHPAPLCHPGRGTHLCSQLELLNYVTLSLPVKLSEGRDLVCFVHLCISSVWQVMGSPEGMLKRPLSAGA